MALASHPSQTCRVLSKGTKSFGTADKIHTRSLLLFWPHELNTPAQQPDRLGPGVYLVGHVNAEFRWWNKVFSRTLCDHNSGFLVEHRSDLWWRFRGRQLLSSLRVLTALEIIGYVTVFPQEGEKLQQEVAEVLADAKPPYRKIKT